MLKPRYYQIEAKEAMYASFEKGNKHVLIVLPTGTGKTIVFCMVSEDDVRDGGHVLILAHRGELLEQARDKMLMTTGLGCAIEKADSSLYDDWYPIVVGSVQSMMRPDRLKKFPRDYFTTIIVDEAHHILADSYQRILKHFDGARVIGVTATPDRGDLRELGEFFEDLAYQYTLPQAIRDGFLCKIKALTIPIKIDLTGVQMSSGDFQAEQVSDALTPVLEAICDEMVANCQGRKTVIFTPLIRTSLRLMDMLQARGCRVAEVNGESKNRTEILQGFDRGDYDYLLNSMLLTEGWDCPSVDCVVCLRPTKIRSLYQQIIGRGTRIHPGKEDLLLLDFLWLSAKHELCRPAHLLPSKPEVLKKMTESMQAATGPVDLFEAQQKAEDEVIHEREAAMLAMIAKNKKRKKDLVDPIRFEMSIGAEDLTKYSPLRPWEFDAPTQQQKDALEKAGIFPDGIDNAGYAAKLLDTIHARYDLRLATPKQIRRLETFGFRQVSSWSFDDATAMMSRIAANGWRVPNGISARSYEPKQKLEAVV